MVVRLGELPDGPLAALLSYLPDAKALLNLQLVSGGWRLDANRTRLWLSLGEAFGLVMPVSVKGNGSGNGKRPASTRSGANVKRTFFKNYASNVKNRLRASDIIVAAGYGLFRKKDSVTGLKAVVHNWWEGAHPHPRWRFDVNYTSPAQEGNSLLNFAVRCGCHRTIRYLVETCGAEVETEDDGGFTPLLNAAWRGDKVMVKYLLQRGADPGVRAVGYRWRGGQPLNAAEWAYRQKHQDVGDLLSRRIRAGNNSATSPLSTSASIGSPRAGRKPRRLGVAPGAAASGGNGDGDDAVGAPGSPLPVPNLGTAANAAASRAKRRKL